MKKSNFAAIVTLALAILLMMAPGANAQTTVNAQAGANSISKGYPVRGFGDSNQVDVWVPFQFSTGGAQSLTSAQVVLVVKPIGQMIGTDSLLMKGASGKVYTVYSAFDRLPANQWNRVTVDLSPYPDVLRAILAGHVEACVQDDTAVASAQLIFTAGGNTEPVYVYDVYYYGYDRIHAANAWIRYQSCWTASDAQRSAQHLQAYYRVYTQVVPRRWR